MKKTLIYLFTWLFTFTALWYVNSTYAFEAAEWWEWTGKRTLEDMTAENSNMLAGTGSAESQLLDSAKNAINWILGILATIALVVCLYAGFLMVTSAGDEKKYQKGLGILKYAALGLAVVGLAWLFVSLISWFVSAVWGGDKVA